MRLCVCFRVLILITIPPGYCALQWILNARMLPYVRLSRKVLEKDGTCQERLAGELEADPRFKLTLVISWKEIIL